MKAEEFEEKSEKYEEVLEALQKLPDEKVSAAGVKYETGPIGDNVSSLLQDLIVLGEVELCQERGTSGRVRLKRRENTDEEGGRKVVSQSIWHSYAARDYLERKADRLFVSLDSARLHLEDSAGVEPSKFSPLSFLDDVWVAPAYEDRIEMTAVVRREPIYRIADAKRQLENQA